MAHVQIISEPEIRVTPQGEGVDGVIGQLYQTADKEKPSRLFWWDGEKMVPMSTAQELSQSAALALMQAPRLRGMGTNEVGAVPKSEDYWNLFGRFNANVTRCFISPLATVIGGDYRVAPEILAALDADVASAAIRGASTIITGAPGHGANLDGRADPAFWASQAAIARYGTFWGQIARHFYGKPHVLFDLINEAYDPVAGPTQASTDIFLAAQESWLAEIRRHDLSRICIVSPGANGSIWGYLTMRAVADKKVLYSVHDYFPYEITHSNVGGQALYTGQYPSLTAMLGSDLPYNVQPGLANRAYRLQLLKPVIDFVKRTGAQILVGEFSASRMTQALVAPAFIADSVDLYDTLGWHHCYHAQAFAPSPWDPYTMPWSTQLYDFNNGVTSGQVALNTTTGSINDGRTPIAPLAESWAKNSLLDGAPQAPNVVLLSTEDFEGASSGRHWTSANGVAGTGTIDTAATVTPFSGLKHCLCSHNAGVSAAASLLFQGLAPPTGNTKLFALSARLRLGVAVAATRNFNLLSVTQNGIGSGAYMALANVAGTNTWRLEVWKGSGDYGARPFILVNGMTLTPGVYVKLKIMWLCNAARGRIVIWQDGVRLIDINTIGTSTNDATDFMWRSQLGMISSDQPSQTLAIDDIAHSWNADAA